MLSAAFFWKVRVGKNIIERSRHWNGRIPWSLRTLETVREGEKLLANEIHYIFDLGVLCMYIRMSMDLQNCLYLKILISWKQSLKIYLELSSKTTFACLLPWDAKEKDCIWNPTAFHNRSPTFRNGLNSLNLVIFISEAKTQHTDKGASWRWNGSLLSCCLARIRS